MIRPGGGAGAKTLGGTQKSLTVSISGHYGSQKEATTEALSLNVGAQ